MEEYTRIIEEPASTSTDVEIHLEKLNPNLPGGGGAKLSPSQWFFEKRISYREGRTLVFCDLILS